MRRKFVPPQHGAWAMLIVPYLAGLLVAGWTWVAAPLGIAWLAGYLLSYYAGVAVVWAIGMTVGRLAFGADPDRSTIHGMGAAFGNTVLLGIPLVLASFGDAASLPLYLLLAFQSTIMYTAVTVLLEVARGGAADLRHLLLNAARSLAANPILIGLVVACFAFWHVGRLEREIHKQRLAEAHNRRDLERLSARLVDVQEDERRNLARELHDETLQELAGLKVLLSGALRTDDPDRSRSAIAQAVEIIGSGITNLRALITDLRPASLDELGTEPALEARLRERLRGFHPGERSSDPIATRSPRPSGHRTEPADRDVRKTPSR